ncbi:MAG: oxaloacetate decarboxylase subunit alpha, partial [Clostridiales bacterium]|nr:oxaloacetate decarboxylase subunit alpha [Clostridiales bacterium]
IREEYLKSGRLDPKVLKVNVNALLYQVPGGMLSNLISQLKQAGKSDKLDEVLAEVPNVRADAGYPPLVTPSSQIVGTQAVLNVLSGERYKMVTKEFKGLVKGEYGKTSVPISPEFQKKILGDEEPITFRPADALEPEIEKLREKAKPWAIQDEDVLSYALFEQVAVNYFESRKAKNYALDSANADKENKIHNV